MENSHFLSEFVSHHRHCELHIPKMLHFLRRGPDEGENLRFHFLFQYFFMQIIFSPPPPLSPWDKGSKSTPAKVHPLSSQNQMELKTTLPLPTHPSTFFFPQVFFPYWLFSPRSQLVSFVNGRNQLLLRWGSCVQNSQQFYNFSFPRERWRWSDTIGNLINRKKTYFRFIFTQKGLFQIYKYTGSNKDLNILYYIFKFTF